MVSSVSSLSRANLIEYAGVLVALEKLVSQYTNSTIDEKTSQAKTLANMMALLRSIQHMGLASTPELSALMSAVITRALPVENAVNLKQPDAFIAAAMDAFINADSHGVTAANVLTNALNPSNWQTNGTPVCIRDAISDYAFFEYYRTADAGMTNVMGALANRIEVSASFLEAVNKVYQGPSWNPGSQFVSTTGELQDASTLTTDSNYIKSFQFYTANSLSPQFSTSVDSTYRKVTFGASAVSTSNNTLTISDHEFSNGDQVYFNAPNGGAADGLIPGTTYWVSDVSGNTFKLKDYQGATVDFLSTGGDAQALQRYSVVYSNNSNTSNSNRIKLANSFVSDQAVVYTSAGSPIAGLQSGLTYYIANPTSTSFQLKTVASSTAIIDLGFELDNAAKATHTFTLATGTTSWFSQFQNDGIDQTMSDGVAQLKSMLNADLLPVGSIEYTTANQILSSWTTSYAAGGFSRVSTSDAAARMWSDQGFQMTIQNAINGSTRLADEAQLRLTRALSTYDYFTRSATNFVARESDAVRQAASRIVI